MLRILFLISFAMLSAELSAVCAQEKPQTAQLSAITVNLKGDSPDSEMYQSIWQDVFKQELETRIKLSAITNRPPLYTTQLFVAAFNVPQGSIVLSSTDTPEVGCRTYTAVGLSPSLMTCPVRVALLQNKEARVIYSSPAYTFSFSVNADGEFDNDSAEVRTFVTLDPSSKSLYTHAEDASQLLSVAPTANDSTIQLKY
jgi:hypothetical protein